MGWTLVTPVAASGQTAILFSSIPNWVNEICVQYNLLSTNGTSNLTVILGDAGGLETNGYSCVVTNQSGTTASASASLTIVNQVETTSTFVGRVSLIRVAGNTWEMTGSLIDSALTRQFSSNGIKALSDTLTQISVTTGGGTNTFDSGSVSISYKA